MVFWWILIPKWLQRCSLFAHLLVTFSWHQFVGAFWSPLGSILSPFGAHLPPFQPAFNCFRTNPVVRILASSDDLLVHMILLFASFRSHFRSIFMVLSFHYFWVRLLMFSITFSLYIFVRGFVGQCGSRKIGRSQGPKPWAKASGNEGHLTRGNAVPRKSADHTDPSQG